MGVYLLLRVEFDSFYLMAKGVPEHLIESEPCFKFTLLFKYQQQNSVLSKFKLNIFGLGQIA